MKESFAEAREELKRADHLIYVSLKYTRSVDVIRSVVERLINAYEIVIKRLLEIAREQKKVQQIPVSPSIRCDMVRELYAQNHELLHYIEFYLLLRKIYASKYTRAHEFRRNVTMTIMVEGKPIELTIDIITEYYKRSVKFLEHVKEHFVT